MKTSLLSIFLILVCVACDNLEKGTRLKPLERSQYFADSLSARQPPAHSIARGQLHEDTLLYTGRTGNGEFSKELPWPVNAAILVRGQEQYEAICANCHGLDGYGNGIIVRRGFPRPPSLHGDEVREEPVGKFFDVITDGQGAMYPYRSIVAVNDRWAIIAYLRALQRSQNSTVSDVPADQMVKLNQKVAK